MSSLNDVLKGINKKYSADKDQTLINVGYSLKDFKKIPFSSPSANKAIYGGIARGRMIEFFGADGSGKTTSAYIVMGEYQKMKDSRKALFVDVEHTFDPDWATRNGVNVKDIVYFDPIGLNAEQIFQDILDMIKTNEIGLVIVDSIATMLPKQQEEETMEKYQMGGVSKALTLFCAKATPVMRKHDTTIIMLNQVRDDIKNPYNQYTTPGGKAFKHACSQRIMFRKGKFIDEDRKPLNNGAENPAGTYIDMTVIKTKVSRPDRKSGYYTLNFINGVDDVGDTIETAVEFNLMNQRGAWYDLINPETGEILLDEDKKPLKFNGKSAVIDYLKENTKFYKKLRDEVNEIVANHDLTK